MYRRRLIQLAPMVFVLFAGAASANDADQHIATIAPYLDDQTILVAHVDVSQIDVDAAVRMLVDFIPADGAAKKQIDAAATVAKAWLTGFQKAGGRDVYSAFSLAGLERTDTPYFLLIPVEESDDAASVEATIRATVAMVGAKDGPSHRVVRIPDDGPVFFANEITIERLKALYAKSVTADSASAASLPHLAHAFEAVNDAAVQVVFVPTEDHRRVVREMFPKLPKPLDAIDGPMLADGVLWKAVGIDLPPNFRVRSVVRAKDEASAVRLATGWKQLLEFAVAEPTVRVQVPMIDVIVSLLQPSVEGSNVVVTVKQDAVEPIVKQMLVPAVTAARSSAQRSIRMNQFKQMALGILNWASAHGKKIDGKRRIAAFPPAAICGPDGKPLLSWRVAILPYLEGSSLYDQFHLDEPWDSEHNKTLIDKMPDVFKDHELVDPLGGSRVPPGHTTYVVPVGEGLVFGRKEGTAFREIKDGTSQTIMIVEVVPELAVPWTKPADWEVDQKNPFNGVKRTDRPWFTEAHCDGSVRIIANDIDTKTLRAMLTRAGGEVIDR